MEDEEGYMALSPRPINETFTHYSQAKRIQGISKRALGTGCFILGLAGIVLIVFALKEAFHKRETCEVIVNATEDEAGSLKGLNRTEGSPCSEQIAIHLCEPFTESASCKLCPNNWVAQEGKCYWFSKEKTQWLVGYSDCSQKRAQMLVVQNWGEMVFIQNIIQEKYPVWIGLNFTPPLKTWTWVEGSTLNQSLFPLPLPGAGASCGVVKFNQVRSEMCTAEFRWICEKEAIMF
ncbi:killer cell lectin-like receptor subfamily F member 1 [Rhineura floridana]|uniref:killer cell lectin-like receptor subfamily F member 1 n=1 Tax=Rhineura floridana TaxID=261503 RepID=UPI002AC86561|nr:killer cell lectin-like receptor subfamily F member 1 [Rhineura floridana]XP_061475183.1 killer cell lectin-like receptor subfamily F member 1 [Rhineura floridana]